MSDIQEQLQKIINENKLVLFMKGTPTHPACGFSLRAISLLKACGVKESDLIAINVLDDDSIRQGVKDFSHWPTIPQLYIDSTFVGGSDIMSELFESGELRKMIQSIQ